jgi:hypothetical protein
MGRVIENPLAEHQLYPMFEAVGFILVATTLDVHPHKICESHSQRKANAAQFIIPCILPEHIV